MSVVERLVSEIDDVIAQAEGGIPTLPPVPERPPVPQPDVPRNTGTFIDATASPSVRTPSVALRTANFPKELHAEKNVEIAADSDIIGHVVPIEATGRVDVTLLLPSGGTSCQITVTLDGGMSYGVLLSNTGAATVTPGTWFRGSVDVGPGDQFNLRISAQNLVNVVRILYREGM